MVETVHPDAEGLVRTVTVAFRPRHKRDTGKPYVTKTAQHMTIGVQRFAVLMSVEEMGGLENKPDSKDSSVDQLASEMTEN